MQGKDTFEELLLDFEPSICCGCWMRSSCSAFFTGEGRSRAALVKLNSEGGGRGRGLQHSLSWTVALFNSSILNCQSSTCAQKLSVVADLLPSSLSSPPLPSPLSLPPLPPSSLPPSSLGPIEHYCPIRFGQKMDPNGRFVRSYIPELQNFPS